MVETKLKKRHPIHLPDVGTGKLTFHRNLDLLSLLSTTRLFTLLVRPWGDSAGPSLNAII